MPASEVTAIVEAATEYRRQTFAHASGTAGVENSIDGRRHDGRAWVFHHPGAARPHARPCRSPGCRHLLRCSRRSITRTNSAGTQRSWDTSSESSTAIERCFALAHAMGVKVLAGSDAGSCGVPHGIGLLNELCYMEQAGMPSMAVLQSATGASAAILAFAEPVGRVATGCRARFILTRHDPLETVANLQNEKSVVFDGTSIACNGAVDVVEL